MKKKAYISIGIICFLIIGSFYINGKSTSTMFLIGERYPQATDDSSVSSISNHIVAKYKDNTITESMVEYQLYIDENRPDETRYNYTWSEVVDNLLAGFIIMDEASRQGIVINESDVQEILSSSQEAIENDAQVAAELSDFCAGANMTEEEYWARIKNQLYDSLLIQEYENHFIDEYLVKNPNATVDEAKEAYEQHRSELIQEHEDDIIYYEELD